MTLQVQINLGIREKYKDRDREKKRKKVISKKNSNKNVLPLRLSSTIIKLHGAMLSNFSDCCHIL